MKPLDDTIRRMLEKHDLTDENELLRALMALLQKQHMSHPNDLMPFFGPEWLGPEGKGRTLPEFIANAATNQADECERFVEWSKTNDKVEEGEVLEWYIPRWRALADLLRERIVVWTGPKDVLETEYNKWSQEMKQDLRRRSEAQQKHREVISARVEETFNKVSGGAKPELRDLLQQLTMLVREILKAYGGSKVETIANDYEALLTEAVSPTPDQSEYEASSRRLIESVQGLGPRAAPLIAATTAVVTLLKAGA